MDYQPPFQHWQLGYFSEPSDAPCVSEGSQIYGLDSSNSPNAHGSFQPPMPDAEFVDQGACGGACRFRRLHAENCPKRQLFTMALEHYFLQRDPADPSPVYCIICQEYFGDARDMLRHLKDCNQFDNGEYFCPSCNTWEHFKTSSRKKCSWLRTHLANKIKKGFEEALKRFPGSKPTPNFSTSSVGTNQQHGKPQLSRPSELEDNPVGELYGTSPTSDLSELSELSDMGMNSYAMGAPQASSFNFPHGIPEIGSSAVGSPAFPKLASEQTLPISNTLYTPAETSPLASYGSTTEVSSVAPTQMSRTVINVSPTSSTGPSSGGSSRWAHLSPGESFSANLYNFAVVGLNGPSGFSHGQSVGSGAMPAAFVSHPTVPFTWRPQNSYGATPTMGAFQTPLIPAATNSSNRVPRLNTAANENRSPMPADSPSPVSPSSSTSPSSSSSPSTATQSPTSDASGPVLSLRCPECGFRPSGKAANFAAYMRKHRQNHSPRRVSCPYCEATFTRLDNCKNHIRTAHGGGRKRAGGDGLAPPDPQRIKKRRQ